MALRSALLPLRRSVATVARGRPSAAQATIVRAELAKSGRQLNVAFADGAEYGFHTSWLSDSSPRAAGSDYQRSPRRVFELEGCAAACARPVDGGARLAVRFVAGGSTGSGEKEEAEDEFVASWLRAFAPHVGQPLGGAAGAAGAGAEGALRGTSSLLDRLRRRRQPWGPELQIRRFDAQELFADEALQIAFHEQLVDPGVALVTGLEAPQSLEGAEVGAPLERFAWRVIGRLNQHPVRSTRFGVMRSSGARLSAGSDYDLASPLSMHTDHSVYDEARGYIQLMLQAQASVRSKVCDGLAVTEHLREHHPREFRLLSEVQLTHGIRNRIYAADGQQRASGAAAAAEFELVHTHPVIELDADGHLLQVVQSETKRGVCALPFDTHEEYMAAYRLWLSLIEQPRFLCNFDWPEGSIVAMNNSRVLHGRAWVPPGMERTMCFGYVARSIFENRYRLLKQRQLEQSAVPFGDKWLPRLPNQVLAALVE